MNYYIKLGGNVFFAFVFICTSIFSCGCSVSYNYSSINTDTYCTGKAIEPPSAQSVQLNPDTINTLPNITQDNDILYLDNPTLTEYTISDLFNTIFIFETNAIITINQPLHTQYQAIFLAPDSTIYLNLNSTIFCGEQPPTLKLNLPTGCSIFANNLLISGNGSINSNGTSILSNNVTLGPESISVYSTQTAINCNNLIMQSGKINIYAQNGINCQQCNINGGNINIVCNDTGITSTNVNITNGVLNVDSKNAISCKNFIKENGFVTIFATVGIICQNAQIGKGYLYAQCLQSCIKAPYSININEGINVCVSTQANQSCIDAETATFNVFSGTLITNSTYCCAPSNNALFFNVEKGSVLVIKNRHNQICYIPQVSGSLMIASNIIYSFYCQSGKLVSFEENFYGLLFNAQINTYSIKQINPNQYNMGAQIYNGYFSQNGQLF